MKKYPNSSLFLSELIDIGVGDDKDIYFHGEEYLIP